MNTTHKLLMLALCTSLAGAVPPGWSEWPLENAAAGSEAGCVIFSTSVDALATRAALIIGVKDPATGTVTLREVTVSNGADGVVLPGEDSCPLVMPSVPVDCAQYATFAIGTFSGDLDGDGAADDTELFVWNFRRNADGGLTAADQVVTKLTFRDCARETAFALVPTQGTSYTGVMFYRPSTPANPRACPMIGQRFAISDSGISSLGAPVTLGTVDQTNAHNASMAVALRREPNGSLTLCGTTTHFRTLAGSQGCAQSDLERCVTTSIVTGRIGGGQLTPVSNIILRNAIDATAPVPVNQTSCAVVMREGRTDLYQHGRGDLPDGRGTVAGWQYQLTMNGPTITQSRVRSDTAAAGINTNPYFRPNSNAGEMVRYADPGSPGTLTLGILGLLTTENERVMPQFIFPDNLDLETTVDTTTWRRHNQTQDCLATMMVTDRGTNGGVGTRLIAAGLPLYNGPLGDRSGALFLPNDLFGTPPCRADVNSDGGVDGSDVDAFFMEWSAALPLGDFNRDGGIDGLDVEAFFARWVTGC
jgi:hypothetical protein